MALAAGTRLGPYEVTAQIGVGGMGEVYRARDVRLGRTVAIKVLPANVAGDPERRQRFLREARTISRLAHPNICTLYDVGQEGQIDFLVMEYLDGQTLAERLKKGALPLEQTMSLAIQIAEALDQAHRLGIVHRDLKPGNIMLTRDGAKLLDFGLAKYGNRVEATAILDHKVADLEAGRSNAPTLDEHLSQTGSIAGTLAYMAPEQLEGKEADTRSDIFSFGTTLYEMLTGKRAFDENTTAALIGSILVKDPPSVLALRPKTPLTLDWTIRRCTAKDVDERWQTAKDLLSQLKWIADSLSSPAEYVPVMNRRPYFVLGTAALLVLLSLGVAGWSATRTVAPVTAGPVRLDVVPPEGQQFMPEFYPAVALSPDGNWLVFRAGASVDSQLYLRHIEEFTARPLTGTEGAHTPVFSPDGQWIAFIEGAQIYKIALGGGAPILIGDAPSLSPVSPGMTWGPDDTIIFAGGISGLLRVSADGGRPEVLTTPDAKRGETSHYLPQFLPGGDEVLFTVRTSEPRSLVAILDLRALAWRQLDLGVELPGARYLSTGHLVYVPSTGGLRAVAFDRSSARLVGSPVDLQEPVHAQVVGDGVVLGQYALSDNGELAYISSQSLDWELVAVDREGRATPVSDVRHTYRYPRYSPDGTRVAVGVEEGSTDIYTVDARGATRKLTREGANQHPIWQSAGDRITFASRRPDSEDYDLYTIPADQSGEAELLMRRPGPQFPTAWNPAGDLLAFYELDNVTARDVLTVSMSGTDAVPFAATSANERVGVFSPDGGWMAYVSDEQGRDEVYIQEFPGPGRVYTVSTNGGTEPVWSPDGNELFYRDGREFYSVPIELEPELNIGSPVALFTDTFMPAPSVVGRPNYDVRPDGRAFVMIDSGAVDSAHVHVVLNWADELQRLAPGS